MQIFVAHADEKVSAAGKKYYVLEFSDGQFGNTFSESRFLLACDACTGLKPVKYTLSSREYRDGQGQKQTGYTVETLELAPVAKAEAPAEGGAG